MKKYYIAPSLITSNLLNIQQDIQTLDKLGVDFYHYDIIDSTFGGRFGLPSVLIPQIMSITETPLDIHIMVQDPSRIIQGILPYCRGNFITLHAEVSKEIETLLAIIRKEGGKAGVALNPGTSLHELDELIPWVDLILIMTENAGYGYLQGFSDTMLDKIQRTAALIGDREILLEVDGNLHPDIIVKTYQSGANTFVMGSKSLFRPQYSLEQNYNDMVRLLEENS